jgi:FixJ family two-component response regulator
MDARPTVFVVDSDRNLCRSLAQLGESAGLCVEAFGAADDFLAACDPDRSGCVVLDVRLPGMSGLDLLELLPRRGITLPAIVLTGCGDVPMAVRALKNGAMDFIQKPYNEQRLLDAIREAIDQDERTRGEQGEREELERRVNRLTRREREVMQLVVVGKANKQVAAELGCSCKTIEVHRSRVMEKMEAGSIAELVRMAMLLDGLVPSKAKQRRETPIHARSG